MMRTEYFSVGVYSPLLRERPLEQRFPTWKLFLWSAVSESYWWDAYPVARGRNTPSVPLVTQWLLSVVGLMLSRKAVQTASAYLRVLPCPLSRVSPYFGRYGNETYPKKYRCKDWTSARSTTQESCILKDKMFIIGGKGEKNYCSW